MTKYNEIYTKEFLIEEYENKKKAKIEIAEKFGSSTYIINKYLKKHGIKNRERTEDLSKRKFGKIQPLYISGNDKFSKTKWYCKCDCGNFKEINSSSLKRGLTLSCGCDKTAIARIGSYKDISKSFWRRMVSAAAERNLVFLITQQDVWELYEKQERKCALSGLDIHFYIDHNYLKRQTASIDRIDPNKGYTKDNIQLVHKIINRMKWALENEEFILWSNLIAFKNWRKYEDCKKGTTRVILRKMGFTGSEES